MLLGGVYTLYLLINLLALAEHIIRHLDDLGFPESAGYVSYLYENARFIYNVFPYLKHALNAVEFIAIWSTIVNYMRSDKVMHS